MTKQTYQQRLKTLFEREFRGEVINAYGFISREDVTGEYIVDSLDVSKEGVTSVLLRRYVEDKTPFPMSLSQFLDFPVTGKKVALESIAQTPATQADDLQTRAKQTLEHLEIPHYVQGPPKPTIA